MKNKFLKIQALSGAFGMILVLVYGIILGQSLDEKFIFMSLVVGLLAGWLIGFLLKRIDSGTMMEIKASEIRLNEGEKIIIEGAAEHVKNETSVEGKLFLTDDRLIFVSTSFVPFYQTNCILNEIKGVYMEKTYGILNKGFTIVVDGKEERFSVEYPGDWKKIITKQQELNRDLENALL